MKRLNELQTLIRLAEAVGQTPDPKILDEVSYLKEKQSKQQLLQTKLKQRVKAASKELFNTEVSVPVLENEAPAPLVEEVLITPEPTPQTAAAQVADYITRNPIKETVVDKVASSITRQVQQEATLVRPDPQMPADNAALEQKLKYLENWVSRIAATGPGGGAAQVYDLDMPTKLVTTSSYTIGRKDYYIGVNYAGLSYITLPTQNLSPGRDVIIKDESGRCEVFPITVIGNVDNDPDGFRLEINNGAIHLIYRDGWRIV